MFGDNYKQENINAGRDVAGGNIINNNYINNYPEKVTWYQRRFRKLALEIEQDERYEKTIDDLVYYNPQIRN